ncbi:MAG: LacI family transcriptional regulator [Treponema sp.]|jgi:LacI family transcriptional regulator|nr:LacI family transcriptional regulator [Treponema sp.]
MTQKDIARDLGISLITVQRALNDSGYVSAELKKRIFDYVKKKSYVPHRASQALVRNKVRNIGVFSSSSPEYFWDDIQRGVMNVAEHIRPFNYTVHYHRIPDFDTEKYCAVLKKSIRQGLDAAAFVSQPVFDMEKIIAIAENAGIPYLMYNVDDPGNGRLCYIGANYRAGGRLAANYIGKALSLKRSGKVLVIGFDGEQFRYASRPTVNPERLEGFLEVMRVQYPAVKCRVANLTGVPNDPGADQQIFRLLKEHEKSVDAVYFIPAFNTAFHRGLEQLDYRQTITVQHDIDTAALKGLDENLITAVVFQDPILQGYMAVRVLEQFLESKKSKIPADIEIAHTLILRENINFLRNHYLL